MKLTKTQIEKAIHKKHNLNKEQIALHKCQGFWYWVGDLAAINSGDNCTYYTQLSDVNLGRWLSDFESKVLNNEN